MYIDETKQVTKSEEHELHSRRGGAHSVVYLVTRLSTLSLGDSIDRASAWGVRVRG